MKCNDAGSPTVLIVEDEVLLVLHAQQMLEETGFRTLAARDAEAAFRVLETDPDIAVLLTDIILPGPVSGVELANQVRGRWPRIHIAVTSGQTVPLGLPSGTRFFRKPLDPADLAAELRAMIR